MPRSDKEKMCKDDDESFSLSRKRERTLGSESGQSQERQRRKQQESSSGSSRGDLNIGAFWDVLSEEWEESNHRLLVKFQEREGHCNVPFCHKEDGMNLGFWLNKQRHEKKTGKLNSTSEKRLKDVGVVWDALSEQWEGGYRCLVKFQQREGHSNVPVSHKEDGINLSRWLYTQRQRKKKGKLNVALQKRLEDIGVVWDVTSEQWEDSYRLLIKFQQREGHCNVPYHYREDETNLGLWLSDQRQRKKKGTLNGTLEKRLEDIGVVCSVLPLSEQWENNYRLLVKFQQRERHCNVSVTHREDEMFIGVWLNTQRQHKKRGRLDGTLEKRLEDIGVVWSLSSKNKRCKEDTKRI